ncbi:MAG TPA: tRNA pseudouridine(13) synthase TruD, partial [Pirellulaceae bacterium]|nr:tRNA pseudouridine(13) synthase TruD [Pirellulaceae bacterium]
HIGGMKLKCTPDDFLVEEQIGPLPQHGPFALYRLTKSSLGTPEAIDAVLLHWNLSRGQVAYAGLKDRHALTRQFLTIKGGPRRGLKQTNLELSYIQQVGRPLHARDIVANQFSIVLRDMNDEETAAATRSLENIARHGLPNYFDSQRFGSVGKSGDFIARAWCLGDYERALWLALAEENVHDRPEDRQQKQILRDLWGKWPECKGALARSHRRSVVTYLADKPGDFKRALALVRQDLRSLYLAAFQSDLWNRALAALIRTHCRPEQLSLEQIGPRELPFFSSLSPEQQALLHAAELPLPSARLHLEEGPVKQLLESVLAEDGMELRQVRLKFPRDTFFSKGERRAVLLPRDLTCTAGDDELYRGRRKLTLRFALPRGSYATILVKRIVGPAAIDAIEEPAESV